MAKFDEIGSMVKKMFEKMDSMDHSLKVLMVDQRHANNTLSLMSERLKRLESATNTVPPRKTIKKNIDAASHGSTDYDGLSGSEQIHRECLKENMDTMVNDFNLANDQVLDELIGDGCLTEEECSGIRRLETRKDKTRKLALLMGKRSAAKFVEFLEIIQRSHNYPHIAKKLRLSFEQKTKEGRSRSKCLPCDIKRHVELKDIIDKLYKHGIVDEEFFDELVNLNRSGTGQTTFWEVLFFNIDERGQRLENIKIFQEALGPKYDNISAKVGMTKSLRCHCGVEQVFIKSVYSATESIGDTEEHSTTSEMFKDRQIPGNRGQKATSISSDENNSALIAISGAKDVENHLPRTFDWIVELNSTFDNEPQSSLSSLDMDNILIDKSNQRDTLLPTSNEPIFTNPSSKTQVSSVPGKIEDHSRPKYDLSLVGIGEEFQIKYAIDESLKSTEKDRLTGTCANSKRARRKKSAVSDVSHREIPSEEMGDATDRNQHITTTSTSLAISSPATSYTSDSRMCTPPSFLQTQTSLPFSTVSVEESDYTGNPLFKGDDFHLPHVVDKCKTFSVQQLVNEEIRNHNSSNAANLDKREMHCKSKKHKQIKKGDKFPTSFYNNEKVGESRVLRKSEKSVNIEKIDEEQGGNSSGHELSRERYIADCILKQMKNISPTPQEDMHSTDGAEANGAEEAEVAFDEQSKDDIVNTPCMKTVGEDQELRKSKSKHREKNRKSRNKRRR